MDGLVLGTTNGAGWNWLLVLSWISSGWCLDLLFQIPGWERGLEWREVCPPWKHAFTIDSSGLPLPLIQVIGLDHCLMCRGKESTLLHISVPSWWSRNKTAITYAATMCYWSKFESFLFNSKFSILLQLHWSQIKLTEGFGVERSGLGMSGYKTLRDLWIDRLLPRAVGRIRDQGNFSAGGG